jgi:hypothetical protein
MVTKLCDELEIEEATLEALLLEIKEELEESELLSLDDDELMSLDDEDDDVELISLLEGLILSDSEESIWTLEMISELSDEDKIEDIRESLPDGKGISHPVTTIAIKAKLNVN